MTEIIINNSTPEPNTGCWLWEKATDKDGYGIVRVGRQIVRATRLSYSLFKGSPEKLCVCHTCDTPACVNPDHLWIGTHSENMLDCSSKGRHFHGNKTHCRNGHEYSVENTYVRKQKNKDVRVCRTCMRDQSSARNNRSS